MKRLIAILTAAILILSIGCALAETWTCPECGKTGNDGQFCPSCGTKKPEEKKPEPSSTDIQVGDKVYFGHYEQDNNLGNGAEKICWLVIEKNGNELFLLSEKALDRQSFHDKSDGTTWRDCELRRWLNGSFLNTAFSTNERSAILETTVEDNSMEGNPAWDKVGRFSDATKDKVFLLSYREMDSLVGALDRMCEPTESLRAKNIYTEKHNGHACCWYWLRTSAFKNNAGVVDAEGKFATCYIHHAYGTVRPALKVNASDVEKAD